MRRSAKRIKLLLFDLDDTLYPEIQYVRSGFREVSRKLSELTSISQKKIYYNLIKEFKKERKEVFNRVLLGMNIYSPDLLDELVYIYRYHEPRIRPYNDVKNAVQYLIKKFILGIITDGESKRQLLKLKSLGLLEYFEKVICTNDLGSEYQKPSEKSFHDMLDYFKLDPGEAAYIGDNINKDFLGPNKIGMMTIMVERNGLYKNACKLDKLYFPQIEIKSLIELIEALKE